MRIHDETFEFGGESTLMSLRNGGGKTVMVQMLMSPFLFGKDRDLKDRKFKSYFTTNEPTFILTEWLLDNNAGYVLVGSAIRKKPAYLEDEVSDDIEIINFVYEYKEANQYDIHRIPLIEKSDSGIRIKSFSEMKKVFGIMQSERKYTFDYYDVTNSYQKKKYIDKLKEFSIDHREWKSIIRKINLKESGLTELFNEAKTIPLLIKGWFLPAVDEKLNDQVNHIYSFQEIVKKFVYQLEENKSKIVLRDGIIQFRDYAQKINEYANDLNIAIKEKEKAANRIANFYIYLEKEMVELQNNRNLLLEAQDELEVERKQIEYEKLSYEYYELIKEQDKLNAIKSYIIKELENLSNEDSLLKHRLDVYECTNLYNEYKSLSIEVLELENKLKNAEKDDAEKADRVNVLGFNLNKYYQEKIRADEETLNEKIEESKKLEHLINQLQSDNKENQNKRVKIEKNLSEFEAAINQYHQLVNEHCEKYSSFNAECNILGEYEYTYFTHYKNKIEEFENRLISKQRDVIDSITQSREKLNLVNDEINKINMDLADKRNRQTQFQDQLKKIQEDYDRLKVVVRYCNIPEDRIFDKELILHNLNNMIKHLNQEIDQLKKELNSIKLKKEMYESGQNIDIPKEFINRLEDLGLDVLYGFKWLKSQNIKLEEKLDIVRKNPFLPYSIIMDRSKIEILKSHDIDYFLSFPIPIVEYDSLKESKEVIVTNKVHEISGMNFYISFNEKLLDETVMKELLDELNKEISDINGQIQIKENERNTYQNHLFEVNKIQLTKKEMTFVKKSLEKIEKEISQLVSNKRITEEKKENLNEEITRLEQEKDNITNKVIAIQQEIEAFNKIYRSYDLFKQNLRNVSEKRDQLRIILSSIDDVDQEIDKLGTQIGTIKEEISVLRIKLDKTKNEASKYLQYVEGPELKVDFEDLKSEYDSLFNELGLSIKEYNKQLSRVSERFKNKENQLLKKAEETGLQESEYKNTFYDELKVKYIKVSLKNNRKMFEQKKEEEKNCELELKEIESNLKHKLEAIQEKTSEEEPLNIKQITNFDFSGRKKVINEKIKNIKKNIEITEINLTNVKTTKDRLQDYNYFKVIEALEMSLNYETLEEMRKELVEDYKDNLDEVQNTTKKLEEYLDEFSVEFEFAKEEFFKHTITRLIAVKEKPDEILKTLETIKGVHDRTLSQLELDLAKIGEEKQSILDTMLDYTKNIYSNIDMIDDNSSCKINNRLYKMLSINQPEWDNELFMVKIKDYFEGVVNKCSDFLSLGNSIDDYISKEITTRNLYDQIIGINKVDIKLYKVETTKVVRITWNEVAENSGGEGFVSAFIVLISLLSYMRKDDNVFFGNKEEGKVIIMDNPFAQTNAEHLLKPLMEISKKYNTQLICFTGLGGDSIYNRFDNIYVLNTFDSKLNPGTQIIESNHIKGSELVEITSTRFLTRYEQETLF